MGRTAVRMDVEEVYGTGLLVSQPVLTPANQKELHINFYCYQIDKDRLARIAEYHGLSKSEVMRSLILAAYEALPSSDTSF